MTLPLTVTPEAAYATKVNIRFPGSQAQAIAAAAVAENSINERLPAGVQMTVSPGPKVVLRRNLVRRPVPGASLTGWGPVYSGSVQTITADAEWAPFGGSALKSVITNNTGSTINLVGVGLLVTGGGVGLAAVSPGQQYAAALRIRVEGFAWAHRAFVTYYDSTRSSILLERSATNVTTEGDHVVGIGADDLPPAPANAAWARVGLAGPVPDGVTFTVWIAGAIIEKAEEAGPLFTGSGYTDPSTGLWTPDPLHKRVAWEGEENASTSVLFAASLPAVP